MVQDMNSFGSSRAAAFGHLLLQFLVITVALAQVHVPIEHLPAPSSNIVTSGAMGLDNDEDVRQHLLTQAYKAAEALQNPGPNEELFHLGTQIKALKTQLQHLPTEETQKRIKELEQHRILLLRQGMLQRQFRIPLEQIHSDL